VEILVALRALIVGSKLRAIVAALVLVGGGLGGAFAVGIVGTPSVETVENRFGAVSTVTTEIETALVVHNPNPIGVRLGGASVTYSIAMNDVGIASGGRDGLRLTTGNTTLHFTTAMRNEQIPKWWVTHVRRGERTAVVINASVRSSLLGRSFAVPVEKEISTDIIGQFNSSETRPVDANQPVVSDPVLYINRTIASWGPVTREETPMQIQFQTYNPKDVPYTVTEIGYEITMNGIQVGERRLGTAPRDCPDIHRDARHDDGDPERRAGRVVGFTPRTQPEHRPADRLLRPGRTPGRSNGPGPTRRPDLRETRRNRHLRDEAGDDSRTNQ